MLMNYLKIALRHLLRYKWYTFIHVIGLSIGIAGCILVYLFIRNEWSYDAFHPQEDRIFRVNQEVTQDNGTQRTFAETRSGFKKKMSGKERYRHFSRRYEERISGRTLNRNL